MHFSTSVPHALILLFTVLLPLCECKSFIVYGHIVHGFNTFNSRKLVDFSPASNLFASFGALHEIGVLNPGGKNGSRITDATPKSSRMVTIDATQIRDAFGFALGTGPFNVPIAKTPTIFFGSKTINDRMMPRRFHESSSPAVVGVPYLTAKANADIRLRDWNTARASVYGRCRKDGTAFVVIKLRNGMPEGLYSMWDVGILEALTEKEAMSASAFGGLPNIITTDKNGNGRISRELKYCPTQKCKGSKRCTIYVSLFYHFDHLVYGAAPTIDDAGPAVGNVGSNHIQIFFNGRILQDRNKF